MVGARDTQLYPADIKLHCMFGKNHEVRRLLKALPLFGFSFTEITVAFVRMFILTHILGSYEFGFAAAISATYAAVEQIADLAIYRFVSSSPRSVHSDAIAAAHALTILRGLFLAACVVIFSYPISCALAGCDNWPSFAWLAPVTIIKSFEDLDIRVGERDYRYGPQLLASLVSHGAGIVALIVVAYESGSHYAFVAYLLVQAAVYVAASHLLALNSYRVKWKTPYLRKAFAFGLPLMLNGAGLAIVGQGDRLMVGTLLGLPTLGLYAVIVLAGLVPISGILRILGPLIFAGLHNADDKSAEYDARLRLFSRMIPMIAGGYALALIAVLKTIVPLVFGARFMMSDLAVLLIALIAFVRIVRAEPHISLLLNTQKTRELAVANLSPAVGLLVGIALVLLSPSIESALAGVLMGELVGLMMIVVMTRRLLKLVIVDYLTFVLVVITIVMTAGWLGVLSNFDNDFLARIVIVACFSIIIFIGSFVFLPELYRKAYSSR
jgi:O-antigen/teichoic acid export membrane protein